MVINVTDSEFVAPVIRDDLMTLDSESVWLTFTNDDKNELRIGVNPAGDAIVQFVHDGDEWLDSDVDITNEMTVNCHYPSINERPSDYWYAVRFNDTGNCKIVIQKVKKILHIVNDMIYM